MTRPGAELSRTRIAVAAGFFLQGLVFAAILTQIPGIQDKIGLGLAVIAPLAFAAIGGAVGHDGVDVAIARLNIANYLGAILGSALIGAAATSGLLRWAFVIPLALMPLVLVVAKSFRTADSAKGEWGDIVRA
jgi:MFS family permease